MNLQPPPIPSFETLWKLLLVKFKVKVGTRGIWSCHFVPHLQGQHQATGAALKEFPCFFFFSEKDDAKNRFTTLAERFSTSPSTSKSPVPQLHLLVLSLTSSTPHSQPSPSLRVGDWKKKCAFNFNSRAILLKAHRGGGHASQQRWWHCDCQKRHQPCLAKMCVR